MTECLLTSVLPLLILVPGLVLVIGRGHKPAPVSMTERRSSLSLMAKVKPKNAALVSWSIQYLLESISFRVFTLTSDNGKEFSRHQEIATALKAIFYFAPPYSSWERELNESSNGLIRQYLPKKYDFTTITDKDVSMVINKLNNRPRKCLGFKTPSQVFFGIKPSLALVTRIHDIILMLVHHETNLSIKPRVGLL